MSPLWWIKICLALTHRQGLVLCKKIPQPVTSLLPVSHSPLNTLASTTTNSLVKNKNKNNPTHHNYLYKPSCVIPHPASLHVKH